MKFCIYTHFNAFGEVPSYVIFFLNEIKKSGFNTLVVVNGLLTIDGRKKLELVCDTVLTRKNEGYDFSAWKFGLEYLKTNFSSKIQEIILTNNSFYGPLFNLDVILNNKKLIEADFWGITEYKSTGQDIHDHIQSYFLVFHEKMINSFEFQQYWQNLKPPKTMEEAIELETNFTHYFRSRGFSSCVAFPNELFGLRKDSDYSCFSPLKLIQSGCPFLKRKIFTKLGAVFFEKGCTTLPYDCLNEIKRTSNYDEGLIFEDLIKSVPPSRLKEIYLLDLFTCNTFVKRIKNFTVALVHFAYYEDLIEKTISFINSFESSDKIVIVSPKQKILDLYRVKLEADYFNLEFRLQENRGRNEAAWFLTCKDILSTVDYVCLTHDKKMSHGPQLLGEKSFEMTFENCLSSKTHVNQVVNFFFENPRVGLLVPPFPQVAAWKNLYSWIWGKNSNLCHTVLKKLIRDYCWDPKPICPIGSVFWARKGSLRKLLELKIQDFPEEPLPRDGTLLHALERLYPNIAQHEGYTTGWVLSPRGAKTYIEELGSNLYTLQTGANHCDLKDAPSSMLLRQLVTRKPFLRFICLPFYKFYKKLIKLSPIK